MPGMDPGTRVCPHCGEPPGPGVFCASCGRNLADVERLPTHGEWARGGEEAEGPLADRCARAAREFLEAMHAAGDPGTKRLPTTERTSFWRSGRVEGWVVRPVDREDFSAPKRYEPGLMLSVDGTWHRLDSELRGHGQRDFPIYQHSVGAEPMEMPVDERLISELDALRAAGGDSGTIVR